MKTEDCVRQCVPKMSFDTRTCLRLKRRAESANFPDRFKSKLLNQWLVPGSFNAGRVGSRCLYIESLLERTGDFLAKAF